MNLEGIKLTQEQVRCKNEIIDLAITYLCAREKLKQKNNYNSCRDADLSRLRFIVSQSETELQNLITDADKLYGKWFSDRCMEIAQTLTGLN